MSANMIQFSHMQHIIWISKVIAILNLIALRKNTIHVFLFHFIFTTPRWRKEDFQFLGSVRMERMSMVMGMWFQVSIDFNTCKGLFRTGNWFVITNQPRIKFPIWLVRRSPQSQIVTSDYRINPGTLITKFWHLQMHTPTNMSNIYTFTIIFFLIYQILAKIEVSHLSKKKMWHTCQILPRHVKFDTLSDQISITKEKIAKEHT